MNRLYGVLIALVVVVLAAGYYVIEANRPPAAGRPVEILLDYQPVPSFIGFVVADDQGFYKKRGIAPSFQHGNGASESAALVAVGRYPMGTSSAQAMVLAAAKGGNLKSIGVWYHPVTTVLISRSDHPIRRPADLLGSTVGLNQASATYNDYLWLVSDYHLDRTKIREVGIGFDVAPLFSKQVDGIFSYAEQDPVQLAITHAPVVIMRLSDFGLHAYGFNFIANGAYISAHPDIVRDVLDATIEGYSFAFLHPEAAARIYVAHYPDTSFQFALESIRAVNANLGREIGAQSDDGWQQTILEMHKAGLDTGGVTPATIVGH